MGEGASVHVGASGNDDVVVTGRDPRGGVVSVTVTGSLITDVRRESTDDEALPYLIPGLVDLQVNGYGGYDVNGPDASPDQIIAATKALAYDGTTTWVPTVITASEAAIIGSLRAIRAARDLDDAVAAAIPMVHVEGPFISPRDGCRGVHPTEHIRPPDVAEFDRWQDAAGGLIGVVTICPHWPGSVGFTRELVARGVRVAIGHSHADSADIDAVTDAGASLCTHLGNGAEAMLPRHPNYIWAQLARDELVAGLIVDGHHLPAATAKVMLRAKSAERVVFVSDAVALAGMAPGEYEQPVGGTVVLEESGRLGYKGTPYLAGSAVSLARCVATAVRLGVCDLATAVDAATIRPGALLTEPRGLLSPGARADLVAFRLDTGGELGIEMVLSGGVRVR